jgi:hypothetical protein
MSHCCQQPNTSESENSNYSLSGCYEKRRGNVICPPCDRKEQYEFSSERSCIDFSELCEDKPKLCCEKKDRSETKSSETKESSESESSCNTCGTCARCVDHSVTSVLNSFPDESSCSDFFDLVNDKERPRPQPEPEVEEKTVSLKKESSSKKGKRFIFTFGPKSGHAWNEYNKETESIYVNGHNGPVLHLYRGLTYFFCIEQKESDNTLVLTNSPVGGAGSKIIHGGFDPISRGCACVKVDAETPRYFYYQSSKNQFQGGLIIVHNQEQSDQDK